MIHAHERIRLKPIYPLYPSGARTFRIGAQAELTIELEDDADGKFITLCRMLDGRRTAAEVIAEMRSSFPTVSETDLMQVLAGLDNERVLERVQRTDYDIVGHPKHRYLSNVNYFSAYDTIASRRGEVQDKLLRSSVLLLGLGAGGSHILTQLASIGIGRIRCVDYDRVALTNLNRQILYSESDIGKTKTEASLRRIGEYNSRIDVEVVSRKIVAEADLEDLTAGVDLMICAIDEPPFLAQLIVNQVSVRRNIPCVYGMSQVTSGRYFTVLPKSSGCVGCLVVHYTKHDPQFVDQFIAFQDQNFELPTLSFAPDVARLCGNIASEVVRVLTNYLPPSGVGKQVELSFETNTTKVLTEWPRYPDECPVCGAGVEDDWEVFRFLAQRKQRRGLANVQPKHVSPGERRPVTGGVTLP